MSCASVRRTSPARRQGASVAQRVITALSGVSSTLTGMSDLDTDGPDRRHGHPAADAAGQRLDKLESRLSGVEEQVTSLCRWAYTTTLGLRQLARATGVTVVLCGLSLLAAVGAGVTVWWVEAR
jgi:hypothetical protein